MLTFESFYSPDKINPAA